MKRIKPRRRRQVEFHEDEQPDHLSLAECESWYSEAGEVGHASLCPRHYPGSYAQHAAKHRADREPRTPEGNRSPFALGPLVEAAVEGHVLYMDETAGTLEPEGWEGWE